jgi:single-stranded-DNA-specific exonuclease
MAMLERSWNYLNYKLIGNNDTSNIIKTVLKNRGIEDWKGYISLSKAPRGTYENLDNIAKAVFAFDMHYVQKHPIAILVDNDVDGICSSTLMYKFIKAIDPDYDVRMYVHQKNKSHGLDGDFDIDSDIKLLIVPDAGSNDVEEHKRLYYELGIDCLCLDHHQVTVDTSNSPAIIVNNQTSSRYANKGCCGASVTLEFCRALEDHFWEDVCDNLLDLAAVANVCDIMPITEFETRAVINEGLLNINNKMLQQIIKAQDFSMKGIVSPHTVGFYVGPLINAFIRMATFEERQLLVRAFCEDEYETFSYTKRGESFPTEENIYEHVVRLMKSYKGKQDRQRQNTLPTLVNKGKECEGNVALIDATGILDTSLTGVVAIKVSESLNKPTLLLQKRNDKTYGGSGRVFDNCPVEDFRSLVDECPYTTLAQGHPGAFGIEIPAENIDATRNWLNDKLSGVSMEKVYHVDFEVDADDLTIPMFQDLDQNKTLWGHNIDEPLFAIKELHITSENSRICGKSQNTIQIYDETANVKYVMFFCNGEEELYQWISNNWGDQEADITIIGTLGLNLYEGKLSSQVNIKDFTIQN